MMRILSSVVLLSLSLGVLVEGFNQETDWDKASSFYDFSAREIQGDEVSMKKYEGHVTLVVNVASNCGLTDTNYKQLVELFNKYGESDGLRIAAFPSNQFHGQEPGTSAEIVEFVKKYGVTFDMYEKIDVNGENAHPLWKWLKSQTDNKDEIEWNFSKFIINKEGQVVGRYHPQTEPLQLEPDLKKYF